MATPTGYASWNSELVKVNPTNSSWPRDCTTLSSTGVRRACSEMKSTSKLLKSFFDLWRGRERERESEREREGERKGEGGREGGSRLCVSEYSPLGV